MEFGMNKLKSHLVLALTAAVLLASGWASAPAAAGPKIKFKTESWDFGKVKAGRELTYEFVFLNEGDATLNIKGVESSCGCTAVLLSDRDKKVAPGKSGKIKVTFNTQGYAGEVAKYIFIDSDDAATPRSQLKVTASIDVPPQPRIDLDQYNVDQGLLVEGENFVAEVGVRNRGELELQFECSLPNATFQVGGRPAAFPVKVAAGKDVLLKATLPLDNRVGPVREFVLIKSNDPLRNTISLTLSGYIVTKAQLKLVFEKYKAILK
jgi:multidrug efflux pump subunit AcrA (membrane-fusion protein)